MDTFLDLKEERSKGESGTSQVNILNIGNIVKERKERRFNITLNNKKRERLYQSIESSSINNISIPINMNMYIKSNRNIKKGYSDVLEKDNFNKIKGFYDIENIISLIITCIQSNDYDYLSYIINQDKYSRVGLCPKCSFPIVLYKDLKCYNPAGSCFIMNDLSMFDYEESVDCIENVFTLDNFIDLYTRFVNEENHSSCSGEIGLIGFVGDSFSMNNGRCGFNKDIVIICMDCLF